MPKSPVRYKRFLEALPRNKYEIKASAIEAGFTESSAGDKGKRILNAALKYQAQELLGKTDRIDTMDKIEKKQFMRDIVGLSQIQVMEALKNIATNTRDYASALKVLAPLAKEDGVQIVAEEQKNVTVPILNVTVKEKDIKKIGFVEPPITQDIQELSN